MAKLNVKGTGIAVFTRREEDYLCITDIARYKNSDRTDDLIRNWLRNRNTIEFLGIWEELNNLDFNPVEFDGIRRQAGLNSFTLTPSQWIEKTNAIGIIENLNAHLIQENVPQHERLRKLNQIAIQQMRLLTIDSRIDMLERENE